MSRNCKLPPTYLRISRFTSTSVALNMRSMKTLSATHVMHARPMQQRLQGSKSPSRSNAGIASAKHWFAPCASQWCPRSTTKTINIFASWKKLRQTSDSVQSQVAANAALLDMSLVCHCATSTKQGNSASCLLSNKNKLWIGGTHNASELQLLLSLC